MAAAAKATVAVLLSRVQVERQPMTATLQLVTYGTVEYADPLVVVYQCQDINKKGKTVGTVAVPVGYYEVGEEEHPDSLLQQGLTNAGKVRAHIVSKLKVEGRG